MAEPRTGIGFNVTKPGWHHVVTGQKPHHEDDCDPDCMLNSDRLRAAAAASPYAGAGLLQLNYEPPIWGLEDWAALHRVEQPPVPLWKRAWHRLAKTS